MAACTLPQHNVENIFMEYSPGVAERSQDWAWYEANPVVLMGWVPPR